MKKHKQLSDARTPNLFVYTIIISVATMAGIIGFLIINTFFLPKTMPLPKTTAINWLVLHNHSLTLDYLRFGLFVFLIPFVILSGWYILLWRKKQ